MISDFCFFVKYIFGAKFGPVGAGGVARIGGLDLAVNVHPTYAEFQFEDAKYGLVVFHSQRAHAERGQRADEPPFHGCKAPSPS